ncbi:hypothetical protein DL546_009031 [Coniochaeta pulveracea]|uniref:Uncharacterized protein n=1 Tax=Coniochaeta pulveracea TaxID=177199 RepID=A0A420YHA6_9PEZI|nr:hypothetical protein DL546_009031 [Coniochaeta pulveracea]
MSPPTAFNALLGPARHELELSIFQGIVHQSSLSCCSNCEASLTSLLTQVSQQHKSAPSVPTTLLDTLEIFSYDASQKVITRHQLAARQPTDSFVFVRPTTTHFSVPKALYLDIQSSIPSGLGAVPTWHVSVLIKWFNTMRGLGGVEAGWWADRFLFEVLMFEYTHFFKVGDTKDLFVELFTANEGPRHWIDENGELVMDCIVVATGAENQDDDNDVGSDSDYEPSDDEDEDEDLEMEDADEEAHTSLNETSCNMLGQSYLARVNTFLLPTNQAGMACECPDYLEFKRRLTTTRRNTGSFEKVFRIMFLKQLGAIDAMVHGGLDFQEKAEARTKVEVVETVVDDLAYALGHGDDERWFRMFQEKFSAGKNVEEAKFADETVVLQRGPRWALEDGRLVRIQ